MHNIEHSLLKLSKDRLARLVWNQGKFYSVLQSLKDGISEIKSKFSVLESELPVSKNVTDNLTKYIKIVERKYHKNEQYSKRECLEISGFLAVLKIALLKTLFWSCLGNLMYLVTINRWWLPSPKIQQLCLS